MTNHSPSGPIDQCQIGLFEIKIIDFSFKLDGSCLDDEEMILIFTKNKILKGWFVKNTFPKTCEDLLNDNGGRCDNLGWPIFQKVVNGKIHYG